MNSLICLIFLSFTMPGVKSWICTHEGNQISCESAPEGIGSGDIYIGDSRSDSSQQHSSSGGGAGYKPHVNERIGNGAGGGSNIPTGRVGGNKGPAPFENQHSGPSRKELELHRYGNYLEESMPSIYQPKPYTPSQSVITLSQATDRLKQQVQRRDKIREEIKGMNQYEARSEVVEIATDSLRLSRDYYINDKTEEGEIAARIADIAMDLATSVTPVVSWVRDLYEAISGKDFHSGDTLGTFSRSMAILGAATLGFGSKAGKAIGVIGKIMKGENAAEVLKTGEKVFNSAKKFGVESADGVNNLRTALDAPFFRSTGSGADSIGLLEKVAGKSDSIVKHADGGVRLNYSSRFTNDLANFQPGHVLKTGKLDEDLVLVQFHSAQPFGERSLKWWTTAEQANSFGTIEDVRRGLALPPDWGPRNVVTVARIPKGTEISAYVGRASEQVSDLTGAKYPGGGLQYRLKDFDPNWMKFSGKLE